MSVDPVDPSRSNTISSSSRLFAPRNASRRLSDSRRLSYWGLTSCDDNGTPGFGFRPAAEVSHHDVRGMKRCEARRCRDTNKECFSETTAKGTTEEVQESARRSSGNRCPRSPSDKSWEEYRLSHHSTTLRNQRPLLRGAVNEKLDRPRSSLMPGIMPVYSGLATLSNRYPFLSIAQPRRLRLYKIKGGQVDDDKRHAKEARTLTPQSQHKTPRKLQISGRVSQVPASLCSRQALDVLRQDDRAAKP